MGLFSKKGWDRVLKNDVIEIRKKLGEEEFFKLTLVLESYHVFKNKIFETSVTKQPGLFLDLLPNLLTTVGRTILTNSGDKSHAEFFLRTAIALEDPGNPTTAHSTLAFVYYLDDKKDLAEVEANKALEVNSKSGLSDETLKKLGDKLGQEPLTMQREQYRGLLQSIVEGTLNKEDLLGE